MLKLPRRRHVFGSMLTTFLLTLAAVLLAVNLTGGEKKIERRIERRIERHFTLDDPRFAAELGVLLGLPFLAGNRHRVLRNGDQIFPPMLAAIRGAKTFITFRNLHLRDWRDRCRTDSRSGRRSLAGLLPALLDLC